MTQTAALLLILGAVVFFAGAFAPTSRVFVLDDAEARESFLEGRQGMWRAVQPLFAGGALVMPFGLAALAMSFGGAARVLAAGAAVLALGGAVPWAMTCRLRGQRIADFAHGRLPGWHYQVYVWLTLASLALAGGALLASSYPVWLGWFVLGSDAVFAAVLVLTRDLPPFVLYTVTAVVGVVTMRQ